MKESLAAFQSNLGQALLGAETCPINAHSPGFRFTMAVRRSWCRGRSMIAARTVLRLLPDCDQERLVSEYVDHGGGSAWFQATESERFLAFLAPRLPNPSHALAICRMSQALAKARRGALGFVPPAQRFGPGAVSRGRHADLVWFYSDPCAVMKACNGGKLPPLGPPSHALLFGPGLENLFRIATEAEAALWSTPAMADASPELVATLLTEGVLEYPACVCKRKIT